jgi:soluble lytic murein transglycosylase
MGAYRTGDANAAFHLSRQVAEQYPNTSWYKRSLFLTERMLIQLDRSEDAEAMMLRVQEEYPELADYAVYFLAEHHFSRLRFTRAAALYQHLTERYPGSFLVLRASFKRAQALLESFSFLPAAGAFERFLLDHPESDLAPEAGLGLARALTGAMDLAGAVRAYQDVSINYPGNSRDEEAGQALALFRESGIDVPELSVDALYARGRNLFRARQYEKAYAAFSAILERDPAHFQKADILLKAGVSLFHLGRRSEAAVVLERMIRENGQEGRGPEALNWLGKAYSRIGDRDKAVRTYLKIVTSYPGSEWADDALYLIGNAYREANDRENALKFYGRLAEEFPESSFADSAIWWKAWAYYTTRDYTRAEQTLRHLVTRYPRSFLVNQAIYWQGRSCEKRGDPARAAAYYRKALKRSPYTYYGYLAAERLSNIEMLVQTVSAEADTGAPLDAATAEETLPAEWADAEGPPIWAEEALRALSAEPSFRKTVELMHLDMKKEAAAELWDLQERTKKKRGILLGLSKSFFELGDYYRSLILVLRNYEKELEGPAGDTPRDFWLLAYPQGYWDSVLSHARKYGQDPYFIAAIIRQESRFQSDAVSPAGARGVMQVMPATGEWAARTIRLGGFEREKLFDADMNINVGAWYISRLMKRFRNDPLLTAAAYNAGPAAVSSWFGKNGATMERDEFAESIPFTETRWYVKRVLANYAEYLRIYGRNGRTLRFLTAGPGLITEPVEQAEEVDIP